MKSIKKFIENRKEKKEDYKNTEEYKKYMERFIWKPGDIEFLDGDELLKKAKEKEASK